MHCPCPEHAALGIDCTSSRKQLKQRFHELIPLQRSSKEKAELNQAYRYLMTHTCIPALEKEVKEAEKLLAAAWGRLHCARFARSANISTGSALANLGDALPENGQGETEAQAEAGHREVESEPEHREEEPDHREPEPEHREPEPEHREPDPDHREPEPEHREPEPEHREPEPEHREPESNSSENSGKRLGSDAPPPNRRKTRAAISATIAKRKGVPESSESSERSSKSSRGNERTDAENIVDMGQSTPFDLDEFIEFVRTYIYGQNDKDKVGISKSKYITELKHMAKKVSTLQDMHALLCKMKSEGWPKRTKVNDGTVRSALKPLLEGFNIVLEHFAGQCSVSTAAPASAPAPASASAS